MAEQLFLEIPRKTFRPGETVAGEFLWDCSEAPRSLRLRLGWWTEGRGDRDEQVVAEETWEQPGPIGKEAFSFSLPRECVPSFSGRLVSVVWGLQLSAAGTKAEDWVEILTVSPSSREIDISGKTYESKGQSVSFGKGRGVSIPRRS